MNPAASEESAGPSAPLFRDVIHLYGSPCGFGGPKASTLAAREATCPACKQIASLKAQLDAARQPNPIDPRDIDDLRELLRRGNELEGATACLLDNGEFDVRFLLGRKSPPGQGSGKGAVGASAEPTAASLTAAQEGARCPKCNYTLDDDAAPCWVCHHVAELEKTERTASALRADLSRLRGEVGDWRALVGERDGLRGELRDARAEVERLREQLAASDSVAINAHTAGVALMRERNGLQKLLEQSEAKVAALTAEKVAWQQGPSLLDALPGAKAEVDFYRRAHGLLLERLIQLARETSGSGEGR